MKYLLPLLLLLVVACRHKIQPDDTGSVPHKLADLPELVNDDSLQFAKAVDALKQSGMAYYGHDSIRLQTQLDSVLDFARLWLPAFTEVGNVNSDLQIDTGGKELACRVYHLKHVGSKRDNAPQLTVAMVNYSNADYACKQFKQRFGPDCNAVVTGGRSNDALAWKQGRNIYLLRAYFASGREQLATWQKIITDNLHAK